MSILTPCNYDTLQRMKRNAAARGVEVVVERPTEGTFAGWTSARYSDEDKPSAWFQQLTDRCVCGELP